MKYIVLSLISCILFISFWQFLNFHRTKRKSLYRMGISFELFYTLIILYGTVIVGFGLIYFSLSFYQVILVEIGQVKQETIKESLFRSFYFSGVTMLTIGYGDIIPLGIGRAIAIIQALIGYLLPTSFVLKLVQLNVEALKDKES